MATTKYDLQNVSISTSGWNSIIDDNIEEIDGFIHTRISGTAGETIAAYKAAAMNGVGKYVKALAGSTARAEGITIESGVLDAAIRIHREGPLTYGSWTWTPLQWVYLSDSAAGELTQTKPTTSPAQIIGFAITATTIVVAPLPLVLPALKLSSASNYFGADSIAFVSGSAGVTYGAVEQKLINDLKTAVNSLLYSLRETGGVGILGDNVTTTTTTTSTTTTTTSSTSTTTTSSTSTTTSTTTTTTTTTTA